jgi:hypothetical protein
MRVPRLRFSVRLLMLLVAIVAISLFAEKTRRRWSYFRDQAERHGRDEVAFLNAWRLTLPMLKDIPPARDEIERPIVQGVVDRNKRKADEAGRLKAYYRGRW